MVEIKNRWTGKVICTGETLLAAVQANKANLDGADLRGVDLRRANLDGANLDEANLCGAYFRGAHLCGANLRRADLRGAHLCGAHLDGANLYGANLDGANLYGANLRGADLRRADLRGAKLAWQSHDLLSELLRRAAGDDVAKLKVAGLLLVCHEWCWEDFLAIQDPLTDWALDTLAECMQPDDNAPECVRERANV